MAEEQQAFSYQAPDRFLYNLLTGGGDQFGLLPGIAQYYETQLARLGQKDSSPFTYSGERIADFSPREQYAMQLADAGIGAYAPFLARATGLTEESLATQAGGISEAKAAQLRAQQQGDYTRTGIAATQAAQRALNPFIERAERDVRRSQRDFDPSSIDAFMNPFEEAVVQQTIRDIQKGQAQSDIARRASDVAQGALGGARSRISQQESDKAAARAMMEGVGAIRSAGFTSSRDAAMNEFARQRAADAQAAGLRSGLGAQAYGAGMGTAGALTGAGQQLYGFGAGSAGALQGLAGQLAGAQTGAAGAMQGLAGAQQGFRQGDVSSAMNIGAMNRARNQALLDLNYQNFVGQYNLPQQLFSGYANFLTGAGPLLGGVGYSGPTQQSPFGGTSGFGNFQYTNPSYRAGGGSTDGKPIPEGAKGLAALAKKAPEVVRRMGFQVPQKKRSGGIVNARFPMSSRKMGA
jgi:hypothetical protein